MRGHREGRTARWLGTKGISLLEVVIGFVLMATLLTLVSVSLKGSIDREGPRGLAFSLASDIRAARAEAQRSGKIVAVCFPSNGKTNSLSRAALMRKGDQRGQIHRILNYGEEYNASVFLGSWPGSVVESHEIPVSWSVSTSDEVAIHFRPDGSAFSNDLGSLDGNYPVVVASGFQGAFTGPDGTLSAVKNPYTIWVSETGSVSVEENKLPVGTLPNGADPNPTLAALDLTSEPSPTTPTILFAKFLPEQIPGMPTASLGQNYVNIHPSQKEGAYLEYGMATIEVKARDLDGGPITYTLEASASAGDSGNFTVTNQEGKMRYIYDEDIYNDGSNRGGYVWHALISWRPPPESPADRIYDLTVTLADPQGNTEVLASGAGLLPQVTSLPPARMVLCTAAKDLFLTNLDGSNEIKITHDGGEEAPFFSADGSRIFSFHDVSTTERQLRARTADGSIGYDRLASFTSNRSDVFIDPTYTYAAIIAPNGQMEFPYGYYEAVQVQTGTDVDGNPVYETYYYFREGSNWVDVKKVTIINLLSNEPPILASDKAIGRFKWSPDHRYTFKLDNKIFSPWGTPRTGPSVRRQAPGPFREDPGHDDGWSAKRLEGYPPTLVDASDFTTSARNHIYNPAKPNWYINVEDPDDDPSTTNRLVLRNRNNPAFSKTIDTGFFQNNLQARKLPAWSADGERIAYVLNPGSGSTVKTMRVLNSNYTVVASPSVDFELSVPNLSMPQLSPTGRWVYYLRGNKLFRAVNATGANAVEISSSLGAISGYVISP